MQFDAIDRAKVKLSEEERIELLLWLFFFLSLLNFVWISRAQFHFVRIWNEYFDVRASQIKDIIDWWVCVCVWKTSKFSTLAKTPKSIWLITANNVRRTWTPNRQQIEISMKCDSLLLGNMCRHYHLTLNYFRSMWMVLYWFLGCKFFHRPEGDTHRIVSHHRAKFMAAMLALIESFTIRLGFCK